MKTQAGWMSARVAVTVGAAALALGLWGCASMGAGHTATAQAAPEAAEKPAATEPVPAKRFEEPGELDKMLDAKPIALAAVKPANLPGAAAPAATKTPEPVAKGKGSFRLQIGAESDVDAAQAKKAEYERQLGGSVDMVFDAPYYKLRWGYFDTKEDAEDKLLELSNDQKIQGFVIKQ